MSKNNKGYVFIDFMLSIFIIILLSGTLLPLVTILNKNIEKEHSKIKLYQILYQTLQSSNHEFKYDVSRYKYINFNNQICLEDEKKNEKVCIKK
ncbi:hypothetical protein BU072_08505 [Mammaliicoccus vitulinus]|uniref:Type II secretion system protein n=2 Tax=Mammaliicoccus vitulinus TaxID=71237 RepID=A0A2T4PSR2_9STAP|nr:hypothetical protein BU072_08505 [Mammaliicoccus vitulinus]